MKIIELFNSSSNAFRNWYLNSDSETATNPATPDATSLAISDMNNSTAVS